MRNKNQITPTYLNIMKGLWPRIVTVMSGLRSSKYGCLSIVTTFYINSALTTSTASATAIDVKAFLTYTPSFLVKSSGTVGVIRLNYSLYNGTLLALLTSHMLDHKPTSCWRARYSPKPIMY